MFMMNRLAILIFFCYICITNHYVMAQTHIYKGRYKNTSDILYTWDGKHLYRGRFTNTNDILYTFDGKYLYRGRFTNTNDVLY